jgi:hypothetical protein
MSNSRWSKNEVEILKNNFTIANWEDFLGMLPDKTENQIRKKASKLGLKRESGIVDVFYDEERQAWVEESKHYLNTIGTVRSIFPAPKGTSFEETKEIFSEKVSKVFAETIVVPKYIELINKIGIEHNDDLYSIFFKMEKELFKTSNQVERDKIIDRYWEQLKSVLKLILDKEGRKYID